MSQESNKDLPWQITAKKLINFSSQFRNTTDEFNRQVGYLLLDVGVETLLRSFLTMPHTKAKLNFTRRDEAAKGTLEKDNIATKKITLSSFDELSFHNLILAVKQVAEDTVDASALEKVEYFHTIRNKIYHLGDGIVPTKESFEEYSALAQSLLVVLLGVKGVTDKLILDDNDLGILWSEHFKKSDYENFEFKVALVTEILHPKYAARSFEAKFENIKYLYDEENIRESQENMTNEFNKLIGEEIKNFVFIKECVNDITFLRLHAVRSKLDIDTNSLEKYLEYRKYSESPPKSTDEMDLEYIKWAKDILAWKSKIIEKINTIVETYTTD